MMTTLDQVRVLRIENINSTETRTPTGVDLTKVRSDIEEP